MVTRPAVVARAEPAYAAPAPVPPAAPRPPAPALLRYALLPLSIVVAMVFYYGARLPFAAAAGAALPLLLLHAFSASWARTSVARFDRDVVPLLMRRDPVRLNTRFNGAIGMRLFAPPAIVAERRGLVEAQRGRHRAAREAYREALDGYGAGAPLAVLVGLAHACFELALTDEAIDAYEKVLARTKTLPLVHRNLAQAYLTRGTRDDAKAARKLLERVSADAPSTARIYALQAWVEAIAGGRADARTLLHKSEVACAPDEDPALDELRSRVREANDKRRAS